MKKEVKERGDTYTIYTDGSVEIICQSCGKTDYLFPENKIATRLNTYSSPNKGSDYICLSCWTENQKKSEFLEKKKKREEIIIGQATNLANFAVIHLFGEEIRHDYALIEKYLGDFYDVYFKFLWEKYDDLDNDYK